MRRWSVLGALALTLFLVMAPVSWAGNTLGTGQEPSEREQAMGAMLGAYIASGCLPTLPEGSLSFGAFACTGFVHDTTLSPPRLKPVVQAAKPLGPLDGGNGTYWLLLHKDTSTAASGWTREPGTHYLWRLSATQPATPAHALLFASVTVSGGGITAVLDLRIPASYVRAGTYDVTDPLYGGVADDSTDVGPAIRAALAAASAQEGEVVRIPRGRYRLASAVATSPGRGITITGDGWTAPAQQLFTGTTQPQLGTWLHITSPSFVPFTLEGTGTVFKNIAFDHDQPEPAANWTPTDYPFTIRVPVPAACCSVQTNTGDVTLENLFFFKATRGIQQHNDGAWHALGAAGRLNMRRILGQFFTRGIDIKFAADVSRISDIHMWPWWSQDERVLAWQEATLLAMVLYRCDSCMLNDIFLFSAYGGLNLLTDVLGPTLGLMVTNFSTDRVRISIFSDQDGTGAQFVNVRAAYWDFNQFPPAAEPPGFASSSGIVLQGPNGNVEVVNYEGLFFGNSCARVLNSTILTLINVRCTHYAVDAASVANGALQAIGGGTMLLGGQQRFVDGNGAVNYVGTFGAPVNPGGMYFGSTEHVFFANFVGNRPTLSFGTDTFLQYVPEGPALAIGVLGGAYDTGGVKKYLCIVDGVLSVGATCP